MKTQRIDFKNEQPDRITVELTVDELALIVKLTGRESGVTLTTSGLEKLIPENSELYDGSVAVFHRFYEDGVDGYLRGDTE